jgi:hypothetical protein
MGEEDLEDLATDYYMKLKQVCQGLTGDSW